ncbi:CTD small phosphatase-like protein 2 [Linum perenne]
MKTKVNGGSLGERSLGVCQTSSVICKKSCSNVTVSPPLLEADLYIPKSQEDCSLSSGETRAQETGEAEVLDQQQLSNQGNSHLPANDSFSVDSASTVRMDATNNCTADLETIFSSALEPIGIDGRDGNLSLSDYQTCNISDFSISDMLISSIPFDGNAMNSDISETEIVLDYRCAEPSMLFDAAQEYMILPFLEDTAKLTNSIDMKSGEEAIGDTSLYEAISQIRTINQECDRTVDSDPADDFDPQLFIRNLPELSEVVSNFQPSTIPKDSQRRKSVTLVLDLDETLVHSMLEPCDDADFTFTVFFNMKEHIVYVKKRPHLDTFLERVAEMFEIVIFTASQSIYATQLLDILDTDKKLISRRVYHESCIFSYGTYTKDLTVLGVDLAKVTIIDNSPQVFRLQVNNGIPIKSWFNDPSDSDLLSLLPFLETLADADDVRPTIARRFGNKE